MHWNAQLYDGRHAFVSRLGAGVLELLAPKAGERILDVGCGTGHLAHAISQSGAIVTGLDSSPEMIAKARSQYPSIEFTVADIAEFDSQPVFDAIFSNAALHWVHRAEQAVTKMSQALRVGGRFVVEFGGKGNVQHIVDTFEDVVRERTGQTVSAQNYFPSISQYTALLEQTGIEVRSAELFDRPTKLDEGDSGLVNWLRMFRGETLESLPQSLQSSVLEEMKQRLREKLWHDGAWFADYRRLRIIGIRA